MMDWIIIQLPWVGQPVAWPGIILLGFTVGFLSGLLGVGGGFLLTPALFVIFDIPYPFAVGSTLAQMVGSSLSGVIRHWRLGNIEPRLTISLLAGSLVGVEFGARTIQLLKLTGKLSALGREWSILDLTLSLIYILLLLWIGTKMLGESRSALRRSPRGGVVSTSVSRWAQSRKWSPLLALPRSGIQALPLWIVMGMGFFAGYCSGLLGVGGGFIMVPAMIFGLGIPTPIAVGTSLSETTFTAIAGTFSHMMKHNVDWLLAGLLLAGTATGVQPGALLTSKIRGAYIRLVFALSCLICAIAIILKLMLA